MATKRFMTGLDLRGNQLKNFTLAPLEGNTPGTFGVDENGVLSVINADGVLERYTTLAEVQSAVNTALLTKLNKAGGELTGPVLLATGVNPTADRALVHKGYVDITVDSAITEASAKQGENIIIEDGTVSVNRITLNQGNGVSVTFNANAEGIVNFTYSLPTGAELGVNPSRMKWVVVEQSTGEEVSFRLTFTATTVTVIGKGASANEAFLLNGQV